MQRIKAVLKEKRDRKKGIEVKAFFRRNGLIKKFFADKIGMAEEEFSHALRNRGFTPAEAANLQAAMRTLADELEQFTFSDDNQHDLEQLRSQFGIKHSWLSAQLFFASHSGIYFASRRGFRPEEQAILRDSFAELAAAMRAFTVPESCLDLRAA